MATVANSKPSSASSVVGVAPQTAGLPSSSSSSTTASTTSTASTTTSSHCVPIRPAFRPLLPKPCANGPNSTSTAASSAPVLITSSLSSSATHNKHGSGNSGKSKSKATRAAGPHHHNIDISASASSSPLTTSTSTSTLASSASLVATSSTATSKAKNDAHSHAYASVPPVGSTRKHGGRKSSASLPITSNGVIEGKPRRRARSAIVSGVGADSNGTGSSIDLSQLPSTIAPASLITKRRKSPNTKNSLKKAVKAVSNGGTSTSKSDSESISSSSSPNSTSTAATSNILGIITNRNASDIMLTSDPSDDIFLPKLGDTWPSAAGAVGGSSAARDFPMESISISNLDVWDDHDDSRLGSGSGSARSLHGLGDHSPILEPLSLIDSFRREDDNDDVISFQSDDLVSYSDNLLESYLTPEPDETAAAVASGFTALGFLETAI